MPFLGPTLDNADPLFTLEITPDFNHLELANQDPARGSLLAEKIC